MKRLLRHKGDVNGGSFLEPEAFLHENAGGKLA